MEYSGQAPANADAWLVQPGSRQMRLTRDHPWDRAARGADPRHPRRGRNAARRRVLRAIESSRRPLEARSKNSAGPAWSVAINGYEHRRAPGLAHRPGTKAGDRVCRPALFRSWGRRRDFTRNASSRTARHILTVQPHPRISPLGGSRTLIEPIAGAPSPTTCWRRRAPTLNRPPTNSQPVRRTGWPTCSKGSPATQIPAFPRKPAHEVQPVDDLIAKLPEVAPGANSRAARSNEVECIVADLGGGSRGARPNAGGPKFARTAVSSKPAAIRIYFQTITGDWARQRGHGSPSPNDPLRPISPPPPPGPLDRQTPPCR